MDAYAGDRVGVGTQRCHSLSTHPLNTLNHHSIHKMTQMCDDTSNSIRGRGGTTNLATSLSFWLSVSPLRTEGAGPSVRAFIPRWDPSRTDEGGSFPPSPESGLVSPTPSLHPPSPPQPEVISLGSFRMSLATPHPWNLEA